LRAQGVEKNVWNFGRLKFDKSCIVAVSIFMQKKSPKEKRYSLTSRKFEGSQRWYEAVERILKVLIKSWKTKA